MNYFRDLDNFDLIEILKIANSNYHEALRNQKRPASVRDIMGC